MDIFRPNPSSTMAGVFPYHAYQTSDSSAGPLLIAPGDMLKSSGHDLSHPAESSDQSDRISISQQARRLYDASAPAHHQATAPIDLAADTIALYNQIRHERAALSPGDPRVLELTEKLRALLATDDKTMKAEDLDYRLPPVVQTPDSRPQVSDPFISQAIGQPWLEGQLPGISTPKNRQPQRFIPYSQDSGDTAGFSFALPYPAPNASTEAKSFSSHASASSSPGIYRAESGTLEHVHASQTASQRLYRVA